MQRLLWTILLAVSVSAAAYAGSPCPPLGSDCKQNLVANLCRYDAEDYRIYDWAKNDPDAKSFYFSWIDDCKTDGLTGISTASHETGHRMTAEKHAYPLVNGQNLDRTDCDDATPKMLAPKVITKQFDQGDEYVKTYLNGDSSSATDFCYLLDEFNAYAHDTNTAVKMKNFASQPADEIQDRRAGLLATMSFLKTYADTAKNTDAKTWSALKGPLADLIKNLWAQGSEVLKRSCGQEDWGGDDYYASLCSQKQRSAIGSIVGDFPSACNDSGCIKNSETMPEGTVTEDSQQPQQSSGPAGKSHQNQGQSQIQTQEFTTQQQSDGPSPTSTNGR